MVRVTGQKLYLDEPATVAEVTFILYTEAKNEVAIARSHTGLIIKSRTVESVTVAAANRVQAKINYGRWLEGTRQRASRLTSIGLG